MWIWLALGPADHWYCVPRRKASVSGTSGEQKTSARTGAPGSNRPNWMYTATVATSAPNSARPARVSGVVFGSEIMKNAKISSAPFCNWCRGIASGSPSHRARANSRLAYTSRKQQVVSARRARVSTIKPAQASANAPSAVLPHWPAAIHA